MIFLIIKNLHFLITFCKLCSEGPSVYLAGSTDPIQVENYLLKH